MKRIIYLYLLIAWNMEDKIDLPRMQAHSEDKIITDLGSLQIYKQVSSSEHEQKWKQIEITEKKPNWIRK